jgi:sec-independent protein translocase protein TatA
MSPTLLPLAAVFGLGGPELMIILVIILLLFGGAKLPALAKGLGQSVKEFKKAAKEEDEETKTEKKKDDGNDASKLRNN